MRSGYDGALRAADLKKLGLSPGGVLLLCWDKRNRGEESLWGASSFFTTVSFGEDRQSIKLIFERSMKNPSSYLLKTKCRVIIFDLLWMPDSIITFVSRVP